MRSGGEHFMKRLNKRSVSIYSTILLTILLITVQSNGNKAAGSFILPILDEDSAVSNRSSEIGNEQIQNDQIYLPIVSVLGDGATPSAQSTSVPIQTQTATVTPTIAPTATMGPTPTPVVGSCIETYPYSIGWTPPQDATFNIRDLGAVGDGVINDTAAFQEASRLIQEAGGGKLTIPAGTYIVGGQTIHDERDERYYQSQPIFAVSDVAGLIIEGEEGTTLKVASGLRYGFFDPETGIRFDPSPEITVTEPIYVADVGSVIAVSDSENVRISGLELDGSSGELILGGRLQQFGRQIFAYGIHLYNNSNVLVEDVYTHHHGLDGLVIGHTGLMEEDPETPHLLQNVVSEYNARQGLSIAGGRGITIKDSTFNHTGKVLINQTNEEFLSSPPSAGLDIEAESSIIRDVLICDSEFINNTGAGLTAPIGDGGYTRVVDSTLWGTTSWALWTTLPGMVFENSRFYGSVLVKYNTEEQPDVALAPRFVDSHFEDKPHPDHGVYLHGGYLLSLARAGTVFFEDCNIIANNTPSMFITNLPERWVNFDGCTITHGDTNAIERAAQAVIGQARFENTHFKEAYPADFDKRYSLELNRIVEVGENVRIDGPVICWPPTGCTDVVPPGNYPPQ